MNQTKTFALIMILIAMVPCWSASAQTYKTRVDDGRPLPIILTDSSAVDTTVHVNEDTCYLSPAEQKAVNWAAEHYLAPPPTQILLGVLPRWPSIASNNDSGVVLVKFIIDTSGHPVRAVIFRSNNPIFNKAALRAAMQWRFDVKKFTRYLGSSTVWWVYPFTFKREPSATER